VIGGGEKEASEMGDPFIYSPAWPQREGATGRNKETVFTMEHGTQQSYSAA